MNFNCVCNELGTYTIEQHLVRAIDFVTDTWQH